ncbi:MAG: hypothetical protein IPJ19_07165 [Planctomycetes bacterium]|nr:hypothetical protein [Planctomycetota bacterium]
MIRSARSSLVFAVFAVPAVAHAYAQVTNAPVAPDTIYVGRAGAGGGLSVIDLNGFGASTGDPTYDPTGQTFQQGWSMYPYNPNVRLQGLLMSPRCFRGPRRSTAAARGCSR